MGGKIGVFDSGVGGLSVLREIHRLLPHIPTIYFADQKHVPYGPKSHQEIYDLSHKITRFLLSEGAEVIVIACHSASAAALYPLRQAYPHIPFVGIEPAVKPAASQTKTGVIGVLTTQATADGVLYRKVLSQFAQQAHVITQISPQLVEIVESGKIATDEGRAVLYDYLAPLLHANADQLVLACTHFPFLVDEILKITHGQMMIVDPGLAVARQVQRILPPDLTPAEMPHTYFTSGDVSDFQYALRNLLGIIAPAKTIALSPAY